MAVNLSHDPCLGCRQPGLKPSFWVSAEVVSEETHIPLDVIADAVRRGEILGACAPDLHVRRTDIPFIKEWVNELPPIDGERYP